MVFDAELLLLDHDPGAYKTRIQEDRPSVWLGYVRLGFKDTKSTANDTIPIQYSELKPTLRCQFGARFEVYA